MPSAIAICFNLDQSKILSSGNGLKTITKKKKKKNIKRKACSHNKISPKQMYLAQYEDNFLTESVFTNHFRT